MSEEKRRKRTRPTSTDGEIEAAEQLPPVNEGWTLEKRFPGVDFTSPPTPLQLDTTGFLFVSRSLSYVINHAALIEDARGQATEVAPLPLKSAADILRGEHLSAEQIARVLDAFAAVLPFTDDSFLDIVVSFDVLPGLARAFNQVPFTDTLLFTRIAALATLLVRYLVDGVNVDPDSLGGAIRHGRSFDSVQGRPAGFNRSAAVSVELGAPDDPMDTRGSGELLLPTVENPGPAGADVNSERLLFDRGSSPLPPMSAHMEGALNGVVRALVAALPEGRELDLPVARDVGLLMDIVTSLSSNLTAHLATLSDVVFRILRTSRSLALQTQALHLLAVMCSFGDVVVGGTSLVELLVEIAYSGPIASLTQQGCNTNAVSPSVFVENHAHAWAITEEALLVLRAVGMNKNYTIRVDKVLQELLSDAVIPVIAGFEEELRQSLDKAEVFPDADRLRSYVRHETLLCFMDGMDFLPHLGRTVSVHPPDATEAREGIAVSPLVNGMVHVWMSDTRTVESYPTHHMLTCVCDLPVSLRMPTNEAVIQALLQGDSLPTPTPASDRRRRGMDVYAIYRMRRAKVAAAILRHPGYRGQAGGVRGPALPMPAPSGGMSEAERAYASVALVHRLADARDRAATANYEWLRYRAGNAYHVSISPAGLYIHTKTLRPNINAAAVANSLSLDTDVYGISLSSKLQAGHRPLILNNDVANLRENSWTFYGAANHLPHIAYSGFVFYFEVKRITDVANCIGTCAAPRDGKSVGGLIIGLPVFEHQLVETVRAELSGLIDRVPIPVVVVPINAWPALRRMSALPYVSSYLIGSEHSYGRYDNMDAASLLVPVTKISRVPIMTLFKKYTEESQAIERKRRARWSAELEKSAGCSSLNLDDPVASLLHGTPSLWGTQNSVFTLSFTIGETCNLTEFLTGLELHDGNGANLLETEHFIGVSVAPHDYTSSASPALASTATLLPLRDCARGQRGSYLAFHVWFRAPVSVQAYRFYRGRRGDDGQDRERVNFYWELFSGPNVGPERPRLLDSRGTVTTKESIPPDVWTETFVIGGTTRAHLPAPTLLGWVPIFGDLSATIVDAATRLERHARSLTGQ